MKFEFMIEGFNNLIPHIAPKNRTGIRGGYKKKLPDAFPSNNKERDRCPPQVGQSIPNISLKAHGSITIYEHVLMINLISH